MLELTQPSATAIAGLFILRPLTILLTNSWIGGLVDRANTRSLMIGIDFLRGILVIGILFANSIWWIYLLVFLLGVLGSAFNPTSTTYIAKFIPTDQRKKFNALFSFTTSGAFLLGSSISGILITLTSVDLCILLNAISFFISTIVIYYLPNVDQDKLEQKSSTSYWKTRELHRH